MTPTAKRFWAGISIQPGPLPTPCYVWKRALDDDGYGVMSIDGRTVAIHQIGWMLHHKKRIPDGLVPDHLCRNRACGRGDHLELVTPKENTRRGTGPTAVNARKTHCVHGKPYDDLNTIHRPDGRRRCRCPRGTPAAPAPIETECQ